MLSMHPRISFISRLTALRSDLVKVQAGDIKYGQHGINTGDLSEIEQTGLVKPTRCLGNASASVGLIISRENGSPKKTSNLCRSLPIRCFLHSLLDLDLSLCSFVFHFCAHNLV